MLEGRGAVLETARDVTRVLREAGIDGAIIGGVAVVLHGHVRTTVDVDVFVAEPTGSLAHALANAGYTFDAHTREFKKAAVPVPIVTLQQTKTAPKEYAEIDGVRTVALPDLISMKLASGLSDPLRAQDLADVIGLIRSCRLDGSFAAKLTRGLRADFRKLARGVGRDP